MHAIQYGREHSVPQSNLTFEVQHTYNGLALRIMAGHGEGTTVIDHGSAGDSDA